MTLGSRDSSEIPNCLNYLIKIGDLNSGCSVRLGRRGWGRKERMEKWHITFYCLYTFLLLSAPLSSWLLCNLLGKALLLSYPIARM
jgi:hypothetical protein